METYPDTPIGELDEYHSFREKRFKYIYLCPTCLRSFETQSPTNNCKFCGGNIKRLAPVPTTEDYAVSKDMKKSFKRILSRLVRKLIKPKTDNKEKTSAIRKRFYIPKIDKSININIFSSRGKEETPTK